MAPRRRHRPSPSAPDVEAMLGDSDQPGREREQVREEARTGLVSHFRKEAEILPVASGLARIGRMARKDR